MSQVQYQPSSRQPKYTPSKEKGPAFFLLKKIKNTKLEKYIKPISDKAVLSQIFVFLFLSLLLGFILDIIFSVGQPIGKPEFSIFATCVFFSIAYSLGSGGGITFIPSLIWGWLIGGIFSAFASEYLVNRIDELSIFAVYIFYVFAWGFAAFGGIAIGFLTNYLFEKYRKSNEVKKTRKKIIIAYTSFLILNALIYFLFHNLLMPIMKSNNTFSKIEWYYLFASMVLWGVSISAIWKYRQLTYRDSIKDVVSRTLYGSPSNKYDVPLTDINLQYLSWTDKKKYESVKTTLLGICISLIVLTLIASSWVLDKLL